MRKFTMLDAKQVVDLLHKASVGIGVVFTALLTILPAAWEIESIRAIYARYFQAVGISLIASILLLLAFLSRKELRGWSKWIGVYGGFFGLVIFAVATAIARVALVLAVKEPLVRWTFATTLILLHRVIVF